MYQAQPQPSYVSIQPVQHMYLPTSSLQYFNGASARQSGFVPTPPFPTVMPGQQIQYATYPPPQSQQRK